MEFFVILGAAAGVGALLFLLVSWQFSAMQQHQEQRNETLRYEIVKLDDRIKKIEQLEARRSRILARKQVIEKLQQSRSQIVHLFDQLVRTLPDGVRLFDLKQQGPKLTLNGVAESNAKVSTYMLSLEASDWLKEPELTISESSTEDDRADRYNFELNVTDFDKDAVNPDDVADDEGAS
jgi:type IV pilus assembly protein PilN